MKVKEIYDQLGQFERRFVQKTSYPIHKKLEFKEGFKDLNDWLIEKIDVKNGAWVLDAGCGNGQTLFKISELKDINGIGISLSPVEINMANVHKEQNNFEKINFNVASFDDDLKQKFDLTIAIESLKHSNNYNLTLQNLASHLKKDGEFWLVEDVRVNGDKSLLKEKKFSDWWHVPHIFTRSEIEKGIEKGGLTIAENFDLTPNLIRKSLLKAEKRWNRWVFLKKFIPVKSARNNIDVFLGGFILDQWYLSNQMNYLVYRLKKRKG